MKKVALCAIMAAGILSATDFSSLSTEELASMRGTVSVDEREAFRTEFQSRIASMNAEERAAIGVGMNAGAGAGVKLQDGSGLGSMGSGTGGLGGNGGGGGNGNGGGRR